MPTLLLRGLAVLALAAQLAHAQEAPATPVRPYVRFSAGGGVVSNEYDYGSFTLAQNASAVGGAVESGIQRRAWMVGVEVATLRAGDDAEGLPLLIARSERTVASQVSALVASRTRFALGPVAFRVGTGIGVSRTVGHLSKVNQIRVVGGIPVGEVERRRDVRVQPLFSSDLSVGREIGPAFVGLSLAAGSDFDPNHSSGALRYGVVFERTF